MSADIRASIPRQGFAYGLDLSLQTVNLDFTQSFDLFSLAMGAEIREDEYRVRPGSEYSFRDFDTLDGVNIYEGMSGGIGSENATAGTQGFGGIGPESEVNESRDVFSFYLEAQTEITKDLILNAAARYDRYDGFGDTVSFKLAANWSVNEYLAFRGAVNTGFRAPSMQQIFFNNASTQFLVNDAGDLIAEQVGTFINDSSLAQSLGIPPLKEENSKSFSIGTVYQPNEDINITLDYYSIDIDDRIVISDQIGKGLSSALDAALDNTGAGKGPFGFNGAYYYIGVEYRF